MPGRPTPWAAALMMAMLAARTALASPSPSGELGAFSSRVLMAISLATSPASWPPMPSATTNSGVAAMKLSSLCSRTQPTSVRAAYTWGVFTWSV